MILMPQQFVLDDVVTSYMWLGHEGRGWTELNAFHPDYRPGQENFAWNVKQSAFPRVWYARTANDVVGFVENYVKDRVVCYGINPRPKIQKNERNFPRSTYDKEIEIVQNIFFDVDFEDHSPTKEQRQEFERFLELADARFNEQGFVPPARGFSGRGYHLLFALPPIKTREVMDISDRLKAFRQSFTASYKKELDGLGVQVDSTQDLRRMVRIYGTAKPYVGIPSRFYGTQRREDARLRDYLINLTLNTGEMASTGGVGNRAEGLLRPRNELPEWFSELLAQDERTRQLWLGEGKAYGDQTGSGFDYSLVKRLLHLGRHDLDDIATILCLRPAGSVLRSGKGEEYVRRTIASALVK